MSKDDRYAHLGEDTTEDDTSSDEDASIDVEDSTIRVTIGDGDEERTVTVNADDTSPTEIQSAVQAATAETEDGMETPPSLVTANIRATTAMQRATIKFGLAATGMALGGVVAYRRLKSSRD